MQLLLQLTFSIGLSADFPYWSAVTFGPEEEAGFMVGRSSDEYLIERFSRPSRVKVSRNLVRPNPDRVTPKTLVSELSPDNCMTHAFEQKGISRMEILLAEKWSNGFNGEPAPRFENNFLRIIEQGKSKHEDYVVSKENIAKHYTLYPQYRDFVLKIVQEMKDGDIAILGHNQHHYFYVKKDGGKYFVSLSCETSGDLFKMDETFPPEYNFKSDLFTQQGRIVEIGSLVCIADLKDSYGQVPAHVEKISNGIATIKFMKDLGKAERKLEDLLVLDGPLERYLMCPNLLPVEEKGEEYIQFFISKFGRGRGLTYEEFIAFCNSVVLQTVKLKDEEGKLTNSVKCLPIFPSKSCDGI